MMFDQYRNAVIADQPSDSINSRK